MNYLIAVCDDDLDIRSHIAYLAALWAEGRKDSAHIMQYESAEAFLLSEQSADILLLDVEMGRMSGVELARKLRERKADMQIVFVTAYPEYMSEGYEVQAVNYLLKPVDSSKLFKAFDAAAERLLSARRAVLFKTADGVIRLYADQIVCAEAFAHSTSLTLENGSCMLAEPISSLEQKLGRGFVRCHRSYLVNLKWVSRFTRTELLLDTGKRIPVSRRLADEVRKSFIAYYRGEADETV